ncbi:hypothetical protein PISMIDRAFT_686196, partial [Pisolithus microcarpus 441]
CAAPYTLLTCSSVSLYCCCECTSKNPGRVVTLIHKEDWDHFSASDAFPDEDVVWGIAYTINPLYESEVRDYLVGSEPLGDLADRIWRSVGPSGRNKDYLYQLAESVRKLAPASFDSHLFALEDRVRELDDTNSNETQAQ